MRIILCFGLILGCTSEINVNKHVNDDFQIENSVYVDYYEGEELNKLVFKKNTFEYTNAEMETFESGIYEFSPKLKYGILHRTLIIYPSGEKENDSTDFILNFPNDSILIYSKRIEFSEKSNKRDTILLNSLPMHLVSIK